jgi:hypothetical protein
VHQKSLKKKFVQRLFNRENYKLRGRNGVRKNFLNLNVADIGAKKRFKVKQEFVRENVFRTITELMLVRKIFFDPFFCPEKIFMS